jgi:hypothetical protein
MRERTVRIQYSAPALGTRKIDRAGRFEFQRSPVNGRIIFLPSWQQSNMRLAAKLLGRHQTAVDQVRWDPHIDGELRDDRWHRIYYRAKQSRRLRYSRHEAFFPGQEVEIHMALPNAITDVEFLQLMDKAGQYKGLSPWRPGEYGFFRTVSIYPRVSLEVEPLICPTDVVAFDQSG